MPEKLKKRKKAGGALNLICINFDNNNRSGWNILMEFTEICLFKKYLLIWIFLKKEKSSAVAN